MVMFHDVFSCEIKDNNKKIAKEKAHVAAGSIEYLQMRCEKFRKIDLAEMDVKMYSFSDAKIPVMSFYLATKMTFYCAYQDRLPIIVMLKRITNCKDQYRLEGATILTYQYSEKEERYTEAEIDLSKPAIIFDMYSGCLEGKVDQSFDEYVENFKSQDLVTTIMMLASAHRQYPSMMEAENRTCQQSMTEEAVDENFRVNIKQASKLEFNQLAFLARKNGFLNQCSRYATTTYNKDEEKINLNRFDETIPLTVDHVYSGTLQGVLDSRTRLINSTENKFEEKNATISLRKK